MQNSDHRCGSQLWITVVDLLDIFRVSLKMISRTTGLAEGLWGFGLKLLVFDDRKVASVDLIYKLYILFEQPLK